MTDQAASQLQQEQPAPVAPTSNPAADIERVAQVQKRYDRNVGYLCMLHTRLPIQEAALKQRRIDLEEAQADVIRLEKAITHDKHHASQLVEWVHKNSDMPDDIAQATALAERIKRLQKEIEKKQRELHRVEAGLPD